MSITAITPTGDRPLAFGLCQIWMASQTRKPDQWLVIDDGIQPLEQLTPMEYIRREPQPGEPKPTLTANLRTALPFIKGDQILIIEDDEYYAPGYAEMLAGALNTYLVAGISRSKYYHLPSGRYQQIGNATHASLAQTGFQSAFLPDFAALLNGDSYLDLRIWRKAGPRGFLWTDGPGGSLYTGIKGLPGRAGIGLGHSTRMYTRIDTQDRATLRRWAPGGAQFYMDILRGTLNAGNYKSYFSEIGFKWTPRSPE